MSEFLAMGGYGSFLWPAYAITLAVLVINVVAARRALREAQQAARRRIAAESDTAADRGER